MSVAHETLLNNRDGVVPTIWGSAHLAHLTVSSENEIPLIRATDVVQLLPGYDLWDMWPVQYADGRNAVIVGGNLWMILCAPISQDPDYRHRAARIRVLLETPSCWHDLGYFMPDGMCPGMREWSGSAVYEPATKRITLYYTVAGRRGDLEVRTEQRLFQVSAVITIEAMKLTCKDWEEPREIIIADKRYYMPADGCDSRTGLIKGFRDPAFFHDPADGQDYMLFTASKAQSTHDFNGVIGIARASTDENSPGWTSLPALLDADGLNNELERPHVVMSAGRYYLFWSTQRHMFAPDGPSGRTGLYGAVADTVLGPYTMLNGSGLVAANPAAEPRQGYSWWVCHDLQVMSFVDHWGLEGRSHTAPETNRAQFGGTIAPRFRLVLADEHAKILVD